ncbi:MAG: deoxyribodipyrimidine photo-lyase [Phocaeicola sp.]
MNKLGIIHTERVVELNSKEIQSGCRYIVYRMQSSVRVNGNLALATALHLARENRLEIRVIYHLNANFPEANYRHFRFLVDGLLEVGHKLATMGIPFTLLYGPFDEEMQKLYSTTAAMVTDMGYLRYYREQLRWLSIHLPCKLIRVEDNLSVPIALASNKQEWAARTIRLKIHQKLDLFSKDGTSVEMVNHIGNKEISFQQEEQQLLAFIKNLEQSSSLSAASFLGGEQAALRRLTTFIRDNLEHYDSDRNHPERAATSRLSPYLHFGMISPLTILRELADHPLASSFIEELIVRRELAHNYVWYNPTYDCYSALPEWSRKTLEKHASDKRPVLYTIHQLERIETGDECWNAAMHEMVTTGFMENTMRMYWGKKIIEWSETPQEAFHTIAYLNNKYELDGRDANSWAGIGWCFGLHDTAWKERPIFGTTRYMNQAGLYRKYDMKLYLARNRN